MFQVHSYVLILLIYPTQSNKSIKPPFSCDVQNETVLGVGPHISALLHAVFATQPSYNACLLLYFLYNTCDDALTYIYIKHTSRLKYNPEGN